MSKLNSFLDRTTMTLYLYYCTIILNKSLKSLEFLDSPSCVTLSPSCFINLTFGQLLRYAGLGFLHVFFWFLDRFVESGLRSSERHHERLVVFFCFILGLGPVFLYFTCDYYIWSQIKYYSSISFSVF